MADQDLCIAIGEDLMQHYPGHPWRVGCDLDAGSIVIELAYDYPGMPNATLGYRLHPQTMMGPGAHHRVMQAGGEMLERFDLARGAATSDSSYAAKENGLIVDDVAEVQRLRKRRAVR